MPTSNEVYLLSGGASGLGRATAERLVHEGKKVVILDLATSRGAEVAAQLGDVARFVAGDVTEAEEVSAAVATAAEFGELRGLVHTAGMGPIVRVVERSGEPGSLELFRKVVDVNLIGTFTVLSIVAAAMGKNEPVDGHRGACVLTASLAAYEGQVGQIAYAAAKAGIVGMTIVAARDLAKLGIRVCTIAPGLMETPLLSGITDEFKASLGAGIPFPARLGNPEEYADLAWTILRNRYLNGETIRIDGAWRMPPR
jgi:NAD(P)-dependent dehydrogenase (short-subunit alcohol dehydrogenase family)